MAASGHLRVFIDSYVPLSTVKSIEIQREHAFLMKEVRDANTLLINWLLNNDEVVGLDNGGRIVLDQFLHVESIFRI